MKRGLALVLSLAFCVVSSAWAVTGALPLKGGEEGPRISMDLKDANIKDVLKIFSQQAGLNFVASEEIQDRTLTLYLDHVTVQDALDNIMSVNNLEYLQVPGSDIFIVRPVVKGEDEDLLMKVYRLKYARVSDAPLEIAAATTTYGAAITPSGIKPAGSGTTATGGGGATSAPVTGGLGGFTGGIGGGTTGGGLVERGIDIVLESILSDRGSLVTDPRTNSVIIKDLPSRFKFFEEVIAKLDRPTSQVMIEAEILETSVDALNNLGVKWGNSSTGQVFSFDGAKRSTKFPFKDIDEAGTRTFTVGSISFNDLDMILGLLKKDTHTKVLSRPRIMTLDNEGAVINVTADTAMASLTVQTAVQGIGSQTTEQAERRSTGISLRVVPQINDDQFVTMALEPSVVRAEDSKFFSDKFVDPQQRSAQTTVMVRDGETVVIGGLVSTDSEDTYRKVPVLGNIPILGLMFRSKNESQLDRELLVFVTPHIIQTSELPFVTTPTAPLPVTVTVPDETREQIPPYSKEKEIERLLDQYSQTP